MVAQWSQKLNAQHSPIISAVFQAQIVKHTHYQLNQKSKLLQRTKFWEGEGEHFRPSVIDLNDLSFETDNCYTSLDL